MELEKMWLGKATVVRLVFGTLMAVTRNLCNWFQQIPQTATIPGTHLSPGKRSPRNSRVTVQDPQVPRFLVEDLSMKDKKTATKQVVWHNVEMFLIMMFATHSYFIMWFNTDTVLSDARYFCPKCPLALVHCHTGHINVKKKNLSVLQFILLLCSFTSFLCSCPLAWTWPNVS